MVVGEGGWMDGVAFPGGALCIYGMGCLHHPARAVEIHIEGVE